MHIAVCEDQKEFLTTFRRDIESYFEEKQDAMFTITEYCNGQSLLDAYDKHHFDIIFMDIELPDISGMEVAKELRLMHC